MGPEEFIRHQIKTWPWGHLIWDGKNYLGRSATNRAQMLHSMFFVIGNGFEWVDGELTSKDNHTAYDWCVEQLEFNSLRRQSFNGPQELELYKRIHAHDIRRYVKRCIEAKAVEENIEYHATDMTFQPAALYPQCPDHAFFWKYPENITPEWNAVRIEAGEFFLPMYDEEKNKS